MRFSTGLLALTVTSSGCREVVQGQVGGGEEQDALATTRWGASAKGRMHSRTGTALPKEGDLTWRKAAISKMREYCGRAGSDCAHKDIYEFGVYTGKSARGIIRALNQTRVPFRIFWGFDSFEGLPEESSRTKRSKVSEKEWKAGDWNVAEVFQDHSYMSIVSKLKAYIDDQRVQFIKGFYDQTLTTSLAATRGMRPALFVEIDCDLYISSLVALEWLMANKLVVPGTLIGYDDFAAGGTGGEWQAHNEIVKKYGLRLKKLSKYVFQVMRVGRLP